MILPIYLYGSPVLREKAAEVDLTKVTKEQMQKFFEDMHETMHTADGCGLAAPQVGISERILIVDGNELVENYPELKGFVRKMINPVVVFASEQQSEYSEGCLSIPGRRGIVPRSEGVVIAWTDPETLEPRTEEIHGYTAIIFQHETDHLDGILYTDRAESVSDDPDWDAERAPYAMQGAYVKPAWRCTR